MHLNDMATDEERQHLLPFVARLACADTPQVEQERETYIAAHMPGGSHSGKAESSRRCPGNWPAGRMPAPDEVRTRMESVRPERPFAPQFPTHLSLRRSRLGSERKRRRLLADALHEGVLRR